MNGGSAGVLLWAVNILLGMVIALIGVIMRMHTQSDDEHRNRLDKEIGLLRQRLHDIANRFSEIQTRQRWADEDSVK